MGEFSIYHSDPKMRNALSLGLSSSDRVMLIRIFGIFLLSHKDQYRQQSHTWGPASTINLIYASTHTNQWHCDCVINIKNGTLRTQIPPPPFLLMQIHNEKAVKFRHDRLLDFPMNKYKAGVWAYPLDILYCITLKITEDTLFEEPCQTCCWLTARVWAQGSVEPHRSGRSDAVIALNLDIWKRRWLMPGRKLTVCHGAPASSTTSWISCPQVADE